MNLFFLISFFVIAATLAVVLLAVVIGKEMAIHIRSIHRRIAHRFEPLADAARLERAARRLNHATLKFDSPDSLLAGRN